MYINGHFYVPQADIAALTARVKEQDQIIALMQAACLPSEEEVKHAEAWLAANPNAPHSDYVPLAKETENAALTARVATLEAALQAMKEMAEYWINLQLGNMKAEGVISKERYNTWLALGHQSKAMSLTRAALSPAQAAPKKPSGEGVGTGIGRTG
jgi:uncharacterized protein (DUF3084 family)